MRVHSIKYLHLIYGTTNPTPSLCFYIFRWLHHLVQLLEMSCQSPLISHSFAELFSKFKINYFSKQDKHDVSIYQTVQLFIYHSVCISWVSYDCYCFLCKVGVPPTEILGGRHFSTSEFSWEHLCWILISPSGINIRCECLPITSGLGTEFVLPASSRPINLEGFLPVILLVLIY